MFEAVMSECFYPSSARLMAGFRTSAILNFPLPNASTVSTQAAAAPTRFIKKKPLHTLMGCADR
jgi:hypothetical protein